MSRFLEKNGCWNRYDKFTRLDLDCVRMDNVFLNLLGQLLLIMKIIKKELCISLPVILISVIIRSIFSSTGIIQISNISCWMTHQSISLQVNKENYLLESKCLPITITSACFISHMWIHPGWCKLSHTFIGNISNYLLLTCYKESENNTQSEEDEYCL